MSQTCDLLIVGGGVVGLSIAYHLARRRVGRVVLLEKSFLGAGVSGKSPGLVFRHDASAATAVMAREGLHFYEHFHETIGGPAVFTRTGMVLVVPETNRAALETNVAAQREAGADVRLIGGQDLTEIDSNARLADDEAAAFEADAGWVESVQVLAGLAAAPRRHGADVRQGVEVREIKVEKGKAVGVETNEGSYRCGSLVLATGPWTAALTRPVKALLPVETRRTQTALFRRPPDYSRRGVVYADFAQGLYFRPAPGDVIQAGVLTGAAGKDKDALDPDDYNEAADADWLGGVRQRLSRRFPALHRGYGRGGFGALEAVTPDGHPILDRLPGVEGAYCAVGFGGRGVLLAPHAGRLMAERVVDGKTASFDLAPLRAARFDEDDPTPAGLAYGAAG